MSAIPTNETEESQQPSEVLDDLRLDQWADMLGIGSKAVLTTRETASVLRVSEKSVREGIKEGTIPSVRLGRRLLVPVPMLLSSLLRGQTATEIPG